MLKIRSRRIDESDVDRMVGLLSEGFKNRPSQFWRQVFARLEQHTTPAELPKYGYLLESDGEPVGVILVIASIIRAGDVHIKRCNLSSWYVKPAFRSYAGLLVSKAIAHKNVTYLNITPALHTLRILQAHGYSQYNKGVFVAAPALQFRSDEAQVTLVGADAYPDRRFEPFERELLLEHARYGCISFWCVTPERAYPFVFRPRLIKGIIAGVQLIYCRGVDDFARFAKPIGRFLVLHGRLFVVLDSNGPIHGLVGKYFEGRMPKFFKGPDLPRLGDLAYTEAAMFGV